ncbi:MAG: hypothetical protein O3C05_02180 [Proteobacteria bacterium]|nr:hypothetical protein [Pseudomonadota bacterium]
MTSALSSASSAIQTGQKNIQKLADDLANSKTPGSPFYEQQFHSIVSSGQGSGVQLSKKLRLDVEGAPNLTIFDGDISTIGEGLLVVAKKGSDVETAQRYMKTGQFRLDKDGHLVTGSDYLLYGAPVPNGSSPSDVSFGSLSSVYINKDLVSDASPTTEIEIGMQLDSGKMIRGDGAKMFTEFKSDPTALSGKKIQFKSETKETSGAPKHQSLNCTFGGFTTSAAISPTGTALAAGAIEIGIDGGTIQVINFSAGANDGETLKNVVNAINNQNIGVFAKVVNDSTNNVKLFIAAEDHEKSFEVKALTNLFANDVSVAAKLNHEERFATTKQLYALLIQKQFNADKVNSHEENLILKSPDNSIVSYSVDDVALAELFKVDASRGPNQNHLILPYYDPLNSNYNMLSKSSKADIIKDVAVYDLEGGQRSIRIAVKKIDSDAWAVEIFAPNQASNESPKQAGIVRMNGDGSFGGLEQHKLSVISAKTIADPKSDLSTIGMTDSATTVVINNQTFTYKTSPTPPAPLGSNEFNSLEELTSKINASAATGVTASLIKNSNGYTIKITSNTADNKTPTLSDNGTPPGTGGLGILGITIPDPTMIQGLGGNVHVDWNAIGIALNPSDIDIKFDTDNIFKYDGLDDRVIAKSNGSVKGVYKDWFVDDGGIVKAIFSNGLEKPLYVLPVATFANINGLAQESGGVYTHKGEAGQISLRKSGVSGSATIKSKTLLESAINDTESLVDSVRAQHYTGFNTSAFSIARQIDSDILNKVAS